MSLGRSAHLNEEASQVLCACKVCSADEGPLRRRVLRRKEAVSFMRHPSAASSLQALLCLMQPVPALSSALYHPSPSSFLPTLSAPLAHARTRARSLLHPPIGASEHLVNVRSTQVDHERCTLEAFEKYLCHVVVNQRVFYHDVELVATCNAFLAPDTELLCPLSQLLTMSLLLFSSLPPQRASTGTAAASGVSVKSLQAPVLCIKIYLLHL